MSQILNENLIKEWTSLFSDERFPYLKKNHELLTEHVDALTLHFFAGMTTDPSAAQFLTNEMVRQRLLAAMQRWLLMLFGTFSDDELDLCLNSQLRVGEVHARVGIPVHLVMRGARNLKYKFYDILQIQPLTDEDKQQCLRLFSDLIDIAMEVMAQAYSSNHDRFARAEESYRLFSVTRNLGAERDKQRAALLDWENHLIMACSIHRNSRALNKIATSEFGLWFRHKGAHAFQGTLENSTILNLITDIDGPLLIDLGQALDQQEDYLKPLQNIRDTLLSIRYNLDILFEKNSEIESGRDVLTRLFNRKFLPTVLGREINYARLHNNPFALLAIDIDHFKSINDNYGHEAGDAILQQVASLMSNHCRSGDFLFRMGGEEFLLVLVDVHEAGVMQVAEKLRKQAEQEDFALPNGDVLKLTLSVGGSIYHGHPDYQIMLREADEALYRAKNSGRNRTIMASH